MNAWISAMTAALGSLALATAALAQGTPVPVPTGPGGGAQIYVQPGPSTGAVPTQIEPAEPASTDPKRPLPTAPAAQVAKDSRPRQLTTFPETTRGEGNSQALLGE